MLIYVTKDNHQSRALFRSKRDEWLDISDIYMMPDVWSTLTVDQQEQMVAWRAALRDAPNPELDGTLWVLPLKPAFVTQNVD
jgi:hypothetical protein